ncbi:MAG: DUF2194 domain-containing protein [Lachnospiraceae bacterium]|nr:DUF2194 domain-containing protein [Lachnospiraceae bacterium]
MKQDRKGIPRGFRYKGLLAVWLVFLGIAMVLLAERRGIRFGEAEKQVSLLLEKQLPTAREAAAELEKDCLLVMDSREEGSRQAWKQFEQIFRDMKVGYQLVDAADGPLADFCSYQTVVILMPSLEGMGEQVLELADWVYEGGQVMFAMTLQKGTYLDLIERKLDIQSSGYLNTKVERVYLEEDFMLGGGRSYEITEPFESSWAVGLGENAVVHAWSDDERRVPVIWENRYGKGKFVVDNLGIYEKAYRGFYAASYSLLGEVGTYPVINGSAFYLDDFPSPVPGGDGSYVRRDYGTDTGDFYTNIWWPDMLGLAEKHGIRYTGVIIENYENETDGEVSPQKDTQRFQYFGNMLLHQGGEIGYHGYNHQPLSLPNVDYGDVLPYDTWDSPEAMEQAVSELERFGKEMFPTAELSVYVPPSNVLSEEGRRLLAERFPDIRTVASNYFPGEFAYVQEFEVAEDGMVEQPRIVSGCMIDAYMEMAACSELNMHFVNNHFMHPDDVLDEDRGALLGWETMKNRLGSYMDWLYQSAPSIRNLTGSELSGAIQRYGAAVFQQEIGEEQMTLQVENLYEEAYFFLRFNENEKRPGTVTGGELTHLTGNLYLLRALEQTITIKWRE